MLVAISFVASSVLSGSYTVPQPFSFIIAILIIGLTLWLGFVFIKDIIKIILVLIILYLLASIGYSFFTTGQLSLSGIASFTTSILDFFKYIIGIGHSVSNISTRIYNVSRSISSSNTVWIILQISQTLRNNCFYRKI